MTYRISGLKLPLEYQNSDLAIAAARRLKVKPSDIEHLRLVRRAVDARQDEVLFNITIDIEIRSGTRLPRNVSSDRRITIPPPEKRLQPESGIQPLGQSPIIVGAGPAGLFCALLLARYGYQPIVLEQGQDIVRRVQTVQRFWREGILDPRSNTQFGEGGAGTFSDGKLTTRIGDARVGYVLDTFIEHGAPESIRYEKRPHVGTDRIREVIISMRNEILALGGEIYYSARLTEITVNNMSLESIVINHHLNLASPVVVLAIGHSARETYRMLYHQGIHMTPKATAMGVRIEHPQPFIDQAQYGRYAGHPSLGPADYHLTYQDPVQGRGVYTFCMCPGGYVIAAASSPGQVVTNGMSYQKRDSGTANAALIVTVTPNEWNGTTLGGLDLQEKLEKQAFVIGGGNYQAPAQRVEDFLHCRASNSLEGSLSTYRPGVTPANLWQLLPRDWCAMIKAGILNWDQKLKGFGHSAAVLTGIETRTSAPVRLVRDQTMRSVSCSNLYPCGEGAGYAGGIVSSAVDGLKTAEGIIQYYARPDRKLVINTPDVVSARDL